jgi:DtxR family Mn-dependent transcriptional regulator
MLPSATVENYVKAIYLGAAAASSSRRLMPMGEVAAALSVAPGTATTMVKTLADAGLVEYEPYAGVALTAAGERLAALVLRRHRLIELFLVRVMGYSWDEVHEEAEQLEHVVTDRLIGRIDEMLGRPETDPHGDPIPDSQGLVKPQDAQTLLTCPMHTLVTVTRVIDQDKTFLRFIEGHQLKPGESIEVEHRDAASDSVTVRGKHDQRITMGTRAASKLLVQVSIALLMLLSLLSPAAAQDAVQDPPSNPTPFAISDNSVLIEEAFNQDAGVVQNIFQVLRADDGEWATNFTQEWPLFGHRHQISYTLTYGSITGLADTQVHYRLQVRDEGPRAPAFSPRVSVFLPTGNRSRGAVNGHSGWQVNLPFSKQFRDVYVHWNAGFTHLPAAEDDGQKWNLLALQGGGSVIWRMRPMLHLMMESLVVSGEDLESDAPSRRTSVTFAPGVRGGWDIGDSQLVLAVSAPIVQQHGAPTSTALVTYVSYELRFKK